MELKPCPLCGEGSEEFKENTHWTGMRSIVVSVDLIHWCKNSGSLPRAFVKITAKTKEECVEIWNTRHNQLESEVAELREALERVTEGYEDWFMSKEREAIFRQAKQSLARARGE